MIREKNRNYEIKAIIFGVFLLIFLTAIAFISNKLLAKENTVYKEYTVRSNDTLWSIAISLEKDENIQKTISDIRKDNKNLDPIIYVGQVIKIREVEN